MSEIDTVMHIDIMFVNRSPVLSVLMPINLNIVNDLHGNRAISRLRSALDHHFNLIEEAGVLQVREMHGNSEFDIEEISPLLQKGRGAPPVVQDNTYL